MNNIIIRKIEKNTYIINILENINIYLSSTLKDITKLILQRIKKKNTLKKQIQLDIYPSSYETIIVLKDYNTLVNYIGLTEIKINIHTDTIFLYEVDYFDIKEKNYVGNMYYYNKKFYFRPKKLDKKNYLLLLELSNIIYKDTSKILDNGLKIKL